MHERSSSVKENRIRNRKYFMYFIPLKDDGQQYSIPLQEQPCPPYPPELNPSDLGVGMTVCIGAICNGFSTIVTVSDRMLSLGFTSADAAALKVKRFHQSWVYLMAGNDITKSPQVIDRVRVAMRGKSNSGLSVMRAFTSAFRSELQDRVEGTVLACYGLSLKMFKARGKRIFPAKTHNRLVKKIEKAKLGCSFLVCGFDARGDAHIFTVSDPGEAKSFDDVGYWAIGSGQTNALAALMNRRFSPALDLQTSIYCLAEAKFLAESATGVGRQTVLAGLSNARRGFFIAPDKMQNIKDLWEGLAVRGVPTQATIQILPMVEWRDLS
jgi:20S proteasome alpha/beta subunit